jgi:hypothetical protein
VQRWYNKGIRLKLSEFCTEVCEERIRALEAEESQLLKAGEDTEGWKRLSGCSGDL